MTNKDDGAFSLEGMEKGLTKREYFAAAALQGILPAGVEYAGALDKFANKGKLSIDEAMAELAVQFADALIKELNK